jgi:hypothetical protein
MDLSFGVAETRAEELINEGRDYDQFGNELFERDDEGRPKDKPSEKYGKKESRDSGGGGRSGGNDPFTYNPTIDLESDEPPRERKKPLKHVNHKLNYNNFSEKRSSAFDHPAIEREEEPEQMNAHKQGEQMDVNEVFEAEERRLESIRLMRIREREMMMQQQAELNRQRGRKEGMKSGKKSKKQKRKEKMFIESPNKSGELAPSAAPIVLVDTNDKFVIFAIGAICALIAFLVIKHFYEKYIHRIVKKYTPGQDNFKFPTMNFRRHIPEFLGGSKNTSEPQMGLGTRESTLFAPSLVGGNDNGSMSLFMMGGDSKGLESSIAGDYLKREANYTIGGSIKSDDFLL